MRRIATGLTVSAVVVGILWVDVWSGNAWATGALIALLVAQALRETYALLARNGLPAHAGLGVVSAFLLLLFRTAGDWLGLSPSESSSITFAGFAMVCAAPFALGVARGPREDGPGPADLVRAAATALPLAWVGLCGVFLLELRLIGGETDAGVSRGLALALATVAAVKIGDSAAYFVGRSIGRHPMCWVSPKKTWEGALASVVTSIAVAVLVGSFCGIDTRAMAGLGLVASLAGQGGDLLESYVKRAAGVKDSAVTFGELGGILDMLDAILLAAPAAYIWSELLIIRGI